MKWSTVMLIWTILCNPNYTSVQLCHLKLRHLQKQLRGKCAQLKILYQKQSASSVLGLGVDQIKWFITPQSIQSLSHLLSVCLSDIYICSLTPSIRLMQHFIIYIHAAASLEGGLLCRTAAKHQVNISLESLVLRICVCLCKYMRVCVRVCACKWA